MVDVTSETTGFRDTSRSRAAAAGGLEGVLGIEDDSGLLALHCPSTGVLAWPAIRGEVIRSLLGDMLYAGAPLANLSRRTSIPRIAALALRAATHNRRHPSKPSEVLLIGTGAGLIPRRGRLFNRHLDYFASTLGDRAWTREGLFGESWPARPRSNRRLSNTSADRLAVAMASRIALNPAHHRMAKDLIEIAETRGRDMLGWQIGSERRGALIELAARRLASYPAQDRLSRSLIRRIRPRLVIAEEAAYGHMAVFNSVARELGVRVAEFQHGMVTRGHDAYNVAPSLAASAAYARTQPAEFLAYGSWWNEQFNAPMGRKVVIGNPHRAEVLRTWAMGQIRATVLVLGDGVETRSYLDLCARLAELVPPSYKVAFRPHPLERMVVSGLPQGEVRIDTNPDLYGSLASAHAVIGEASTGLFEAVGIVPRVCVWDTAKSRFYLGDHPFERFGEPSELLASLVADHAGSHVGALAETTWAGEWERRFRQFIDEPV